jgi:hypothetical protein
MWRGFSYPLPSGHDPGPTADSRQPTRNLFLVWRRRRRRRRPWISPIPDPRLGESYASFFRYFHPPLPLGGRKSGIKGVDFLGGDPGSSTRREAGRRGPYHIKRPPERGGYD